MTDFVLFTVLARETTWLSVGPGTVQVELVAMKSSLLACLGVTSKIVGSPRTQGKAVLGRRECVRAYF